ncbi:MAG: glycoside hydrolase family 2 protein [Flavobacterium sp.]
MKGYTGKWSDNYIDLKAGEERIISFEGKITKPVLKVYSLYDVLKRY